MESRYTLWSAASAGVAAAEGHESTPAVDDIEGALSVVEAERGGELLYVEVADESPQPGRVERDMPFAAPFAEAIAAAVASGVRHDIPTPPTIGSIQAEVQELKQRRMREAGIASIRIPKRTEKLRDAICAMLRHRDDGRNPSAAQAVWEAGLTWEAGFGKAGAAKLTYRVTVKAADVNAAICLMHALPFVQRLRQDEGWLREVTSGHQSLAALAKTLWNAHLSFVGRGDTQSMGSHVTPAGAALRRGRGFWHGEARELVARGLTGNQIAKQLQQKVKTVETFLRRERLATQIA